MQRYIYLCAVYIFVCYPVTQHQRRFLSSQSNSADHDVIGEEESERWWLAGADRRRAAIHNARPGAKAGPLPVDERK